jgi:c-di-GMP-binding flagellar brake protein YcgR
MSDKRRCLRFSIELPAWYKNSKNNDFLNAVTLDISATGICFVAEEEIEVGQELLMKVKLPPRETILINTKVVWVRGLFGSGATEHRVGVKIIEPIRFDEAKFVQFCAKIMLDLFKPT